MVEELRDWGLGNGERDVVFFAVCTGFLNMALTLFFNQPYLAWARVSAQAFTISSGVTLRERSLIGFANP